MPWVVKTLEYVSWLLGYADVGVHGCAGAQVFHSLGGLETHFLTERVNTMLEGVVTTLLKSRM